MPELRERTTGAWTPGERLQAEVAALAARLADVLSSAPAAVPVADAVAFLRAHASAFPLRAVGGDPMHPIDRLARVMRLSPFEVDVLLLAGLPEEHEGLAGVLRTLHPRGEPRVTIGLAAQVLCESNAERRLLREVFETGRLARTGAIQVAADAPFFERSVVPAEALWSALAGVDAWPNSTPSLELAPSSEGLHDWLAEPEAARAARALGHADPCTVLVTAEAEDAAAHRAAALAAHAGVHAVGIAIPAGATPGAVKTALLHAIVRGAVPLLRIAAEDGPGAAPLPCLDGFPAPAVVCARAGCGAVRGLRPVIALRADRIGLTARAAVWRSSLPDLAAHAPLLAARYALDASAAAEIATDVAAAAALDGRSAELRDVADSVRVRSAVPLASGVQLVRPVARFEDLVLPSDRLAQLREAVARLVYQARVIDDWGFLAGRKGARGVRMLLAGPPGTGKSLTAEVLASALGVDLLAVDISRVVSKWIGETEKNLAAVFDVAERSQAVLLFDEADALFGKRTEISDAHDRYANLETAYLLARLERFEGLAVLATNLRQNIDAAFLRRLEFVVDFEEPGQAEREALWRCHIPQSAPVAPDVDLRELATIYPIVGGLIRNAAVAAAFVAAAEERPISRRHLMRAIRREYEKAGRTFPGAPAGISGAQGDFP